MLKPTIKETGITDTEKYLSKLSEDTFFGLWSYPNVYTDEGISKTGTGKELCDLLVVFENKILIFSDKNISFNSEIDTRVAWKRWFKRAVLKSSKQLFGAESWLRNNPDRVYIDKKCNTPFPIELNKEDYEIHLIAVTYNTAENAAQEWGGGSSGTFLQIYHYDQKECFNHPFIIGDIFPNKTYVHVLDEISLKLLMNELDTISDFVEYLEIKEKSIRKGVIIHSAGEEELLAYYFRNLITPLKINEKSDAIILAEGLWSDFKHSEDYVTLLTIREQGSFLDSLIKNFSCNILNGTVGRGEDLEFEYHERAVRHFAAENRVARGILSYAFLEKFNEVPKDRRSSRLIYSPSKKDKLYVFLFFPRSKSQDYHDYRDERLHYVKAYSLVAKYLYTKMKHVIVLATEPQQSECRSEDIYSVEYDKELSEEEKNMAQSLIKEERILSDIVKEKTNLLDIINNKPRPYRCKKPKYGRNAKCSCGSGKKYKKCCM